MAKTVCVVGASDGKFVIPLALDGYHVVAVERDNAAVYGGAVRLPGNDRGQMPGLRSRAQAEGVADRIEIRAQDLLGPESLPSCDAVWTSCSWHYSVNHSRPLGEFIMHMQDACAVGGLLGAEYMMPVEFRHQAIEHYLEHGEIHRYFTGWDVVHEAYTPSFIEAPHVGQLEPHQHRMGLFIARRPT